MSQHVIPMWLRHTSNVCQTSICHTSTFDKHQYVIHQRMSNINMSYINVCQTSICHTSTYVKHQYVIHRRMSNINNVVVTSIINVCFIQPIHITPYGRTSYRQGMSYLPLIYNKSAVIPSMYAAARHSFTYRFSSNHQPCQFFVTAPSRTL